MSIKVMVKATSGNSDIRETFSDKSEEEKYDSWLLKNYIECKIESTHLKLAKTMIKLYFTNGKEIDIKIEAPNRNGSTKETIFEITNIKEAKP